MWIGIGSKCFGSVLDRRFNSRGYRLYWQESGVNSIISLNVHYYVRGRQKETVGKSKK